MVTVNKQPLAVVPAHNDIEFFATSDQYTQPNFQFNITISLPAFGLTLFYLKDADDSGNVYFNCVDVARKYVNYAYPFGTYGWQDCQVSVLHMTVNIGEQYGSSVVEYPGTDFSFKAFNAALTQDERRIYIPTDFEVQIGRNNIWLNRFENGNIIDGNVTLKGNQDMTIYFLQTGTYNVEDLSITDLSAVHATPSIILNPLFNSDMCCINVGPNGLNGITSGQVASGPFPVLPTTSTSYQVKFRYSVAGIGTPIYASFIVNISNCAPRFDNEAVFYLNRFGAFDFQIFYGNHKTNLVINKTYYKGLNSYFQGSYNDTTNGDTLGPNPQDMSRKSLSIDYSKNVVLQSDWLTDFQLQVAEDLVTSPVVFINKGMADYKRCSEEDTQYVYKDRTEKIKALQVTVPEGITERRQLG